MFNEWKHDQAVFRLKNYGDILVPFLCSFLSLGLCLETFIWDLEVLGGNVMEIITTVCLFNKHIAASHYAPVLG